MVAASGQRAPGKVCHHRVAQPCTGVRALAATGQCQPPGSAGHGSVGGGGGEDLNCQRAAPITERVEPAEFGREYKEIVQPKRQKEQQGSPARNDGVEENVQRNAREDARRESKKEIVQPKRQKEQQGSPAQDDGLEGSARLKLKGGEPNTAEPRRDRPAHAPKGAARLTSTERQRRGWCAA